MRRPSHAEPKKSAEMATTEKGARGGAWRSPRPWTGFSKRFVDWVRSGALRALGELDSELQDAALDTLGEALRQRLRQFPEAGDPHVAASAYKEDGRPVVDRDAKDSRHHRAVGAKHPLIHPDHGSQGTYQGGNCEEPAPQEILPIGLKQHSVPSLQP
jgi:hypothetical protein